MGVNVFKNGPSKIYGRQPLNSCIYVNIMNILPTKTYMKKVTKPQNALQNVLLSFHRLHLENAQTYDVKFQ